MANNPFQIEPGRYRNPAALLPVDSDKRVRDLFLSRIHKLRQVALAVLLMLGVFGGTALAERIYTVSSEIDLVGAVDDNPQVSGLGLFNQEEDYITSYGVYPSIRLNSEGPNTEYQLYYVFGLNRMDTSLDLDSESHEAGALLRGNLSRNVSLRITERFRKSPDFGTFSFFRGIVFTPEGMFFDYENVALRRDSYHNDTTAMIGYRFGPRSTLSFGGGTSVRNFEADPLFARRYPNQNQYNGTIKLTRDLNARTGWSIGYNMTHHDFRQVYSDARVHDATIGLNHQISRTAALTMEAGPSYTEFLGDTTESSSYTGYNARLNVTKSFEDEEISLSYRRRSGAGVGFGGLSRTQEVAFHFMRPLGRSTLINFGATLFDTDRVFENPYETRGLRTSLVWSYLISPNWKINVGASYVSQDSPNIESDLPSFLDLERRRVYVSLTFVLPNMWRFSR